ncbi:MAG TPA: hypothetical protein VHU81_07685 [Thermoanaerobaculia bacterium]|nr:hypothetical protein [Thermoanaerobaculia bacterium]
MKKRVEKKLRLNRETILNLKKVVGGAVYNLQQQDDVYTDTDGDGFPSGGGVICYISDCNPCDTQRC